ncbi:neck passage structure protein [Lactococcus cremoris]|nr:neck passage structure protein [Lactococcus cremoris]
MADIIKIIRGMQNGAETIDNNFSKMNTEMKQKADKGEIDAKLSQISSVPETFANLSALQSTYPNGKTGLFVTADTGHKFIWANNMWVDAGAYQSAGIDYNVDGIRKYTPGKTSGAIIPFDGTVVSANAVYYTVDVTNVDKLTFLSESFSLNYGYAFYDANGVFIPGSGLLEKSVGYATVDVPVMATTFKVTSRLETNQLVTLYYNNASVEVNSDTTELLKTTVYGNKKNLKSRYYQHDNKLISTTTGKYVKVANSSSVLIPVYELGKAVKITGNTTNSSNYTFLKTLTGGVGDTPDYVTGYTGTIPLSLGQTKVIKVPSTAGYLFVSNTFDDGQIKQTYPSIISPLKDTNITLAASNSSDLDKSRADFIGTGTNDELMFNNAITALVYGGTIKLLDGDYYIDSFPYHNNSAVYFENNGYARTINFEGSTENKSFLSDYGVSIHVTKTAFDSTVSGEDYNVFIGSETTIPIGVWQGLPNNVNFKNFYLFFDTSQKQMVGINGQYFGSMYLEQIGVYSKNYFNDRFDRHKPVTPAINSIGIISVNGANDEMARIGMDTVNVGGLGTGIIVARAEHLIMRNSTVSRCVIGYQFIGNSDKPLTLINNADEGNTHLPQFKGRGLITSIDFSIERLDADAMPDDPTGNTNPCAVEQTPGAWKGFFDYNIQGSALGIRNFWSPESGKNIKTRNINSDKFGTTNPANPDYLQEFFRTDLNKKVIYNGSGWYDAAGNVVS